MAIIPVPMPGIPHATPRASFDHLDTLWVQVAGTLCNLECTHCFISCGPANDTHGMMTREAVRTHLAEARRLGVKDLYFTGGEPFLNPEMLGILEDALEVGPANVLTNGLLLPDHRIEELARIRDAARYSLELRVSVDGWNAAQHDAVRGPGNWAKTLDAIRRLEAAGFLPILTTTEIWTGGDDGTREPGHGAYNKLKAALKDVGVKRPRIKIIPLFDLGRGADIVPDGSPIAARSQGILRPEEMDPAFDWSNLQCTSSRIVTSEGIFTCPLLINEKRARWPGTLEESLTGFHLDHSACRTCVVTGMTCRNW